MLIGDADDRSLATGQVEDFPSHCILCVVRHLDNFFLSGQGHGFEFGLALAPDTLAVDVVAAAVAQRCPIAMPRDWKHKPAQRRRPVEPEQSQASVSLTEPPQRCAPARLADEVEDKPVDGTGAQKRQQFAAPEARAISFFENALRREQPRSKGVAHPKARERVLKTCLLTDDRMVALHRGPRQPEIGNLPKGRGLRISRSARFRKKATVRATYSACRLKPANMQLATVPRPLRINRYA